MYKVTNFIDGKECIESNESMSIVNPSYGTQIGEVIYATSNSTNKAIEAAAKTFKTWSKTGLSYRAEMMLKLRQHQQPINCAKRPLPCWCVDQNVTR